MLQRQRSETAIGVHPFTREHSTGVHGLLMNSFRADDPISHTKGLITQDMETGEPFGALIDATVGNGFSHVAVNISTSRVVGFMLNIDQQTSCGDESDPGPRFSGRTLHAVNFLKNLESTTDCLQPTQPIPVAKQISENVDTVDMESDFESCHSKSDDSVTDCNADHFVDACTIELSKNVETENLQTDDKTDNFDVDSLNRHTGNELNNNTLRVLKCEAFHLESQYLEGSVLEDLIEASYTSALTETFPSNQASDRDSLPQDTSSPGQLSHFVLTLKTETLQELLGIEFGFNLLKFRDLSDYQVNGERVFQKLRPETALAFFMAKDLRSVVLKPKIQVPQKMLTKKIHLDSDSESSSSSSSE